jgi:3',5'-cyclic AMP phosphodiesterase CpdA
MFRLAHLSDIHLGPLPEVTYRQLASKRVTGYVNWQRNRRQHIKDDVLTSLVEDMRTVKPDHIALTGDLVNLALDAEVELARLWLHAFGKPEDVSVVPGNHDAYVPGAFDKICRAWGGFMAGDGAVAPINRGAFPYLRVRGPVALIGVTSARATAPFMANGFFREGQAARLGKLLDSAAKKSLFRVVMIHHPPVRGAAAQHKRLFGISLFQRTIMRHGAELVLHGHTHYSTVNWIAGPEDPVPVVGVSAGGQAPGGELPPAQYNLFEISGNPGGWIVRMNRRGLTGLSTGVSQISSDVLIDQTEPLETVPAEVSA